MAVGFSLSVSTPIYAAIEGVPCTDEPTDMRITYGDLVNCSIAAAGDTDIFRFEGVTGEKISINLTRLTGPGLPDVLVYRPDGTSITIGFPSDRTGTLDQTGTYTMIVESGQTVAYAIDLQRVTPPSQNARSMEYGPKLADEIRGLGDVDVLSFYGIAGTTVRIEPATVRASGNACIALFRPDGSTPFTGCGLAPITETLGATGTYSIRVAEFLDNAAIRYSVTLQCVSGTCPIFVQPTGSVACYSTGSSGSGKTFIRVCVSNRGNLVRFESPQAVEHLRIRAHAEGTPCVVPRALTVLTPVT